jgi:hypothetical protein
MGAQGNNSLNGLASVIARRLVAVDELHNGHTPPGERARQFSLMCDNARLGSGPLSTADLQRLAVELVPEQLARYRMAA